MDCVKIRDPVEEINGLIIVVYKLIFSETYNADGRQ